MNDFISWVGPILREMWPIFLATFFGAGAAFQFQKSWEKSKEKTRNFHAGKRAQFAFVSQYNVLITLNKQYLAKYRDDPNKYISLKPNFISFDFQRVDVDSLLFILDDGDDANLVNEIDVTQQKFLTVMGVLERRSQYYSDVVSKVTVGCSPLEMAAIVRLQMVLDKSGLKLREGFRSHIIHSCLSGKPQKAVLLPS